MAPLTKILAICAFATSLVAAAPMPKPADLAALAARDPSRKLDVITKDEEDYVLVPISGKKGDLTIHIGPTDEDVSDKRDTADVDAVAYNPAYFYAYKGGYGYIN
jgi:hypothetical protein